MTEPDFHITPLIDSAALAESKALMQEKFTKLVGYFFEDSASYVSKIEQGFTGKNAEAIVPPAHTLKSSARQMGAARLSAIAEYIEHTARELIKTGGDIRILESSIAALAPILQATLAAYK